MRQELDGQGVRKGIRALGLMLLIYHRVRARDLNMSEAKERVGWIKPSANGSEWRGFGVFKYRSG